MAKPKKTKQVFKPGIRVEDDAWTLGNDIKNLFSLTGTRTTIGLIFTDLIRKHGPGIKASLQKKWEKINEKAEKQAKN